MTLGVAVIGAGVVGSRRAATAASQSRLEIVADVDQARAAALANVHGVRHTNRWEEAVSDPNVDVVVASTPNKFLAPIAIAALNAGKHVLCEKPMGRNASEAADIASAARRANRVLKVGFNLRFHPALRQAHQLCAADELGPLLFISATYGHGGRAGYESEWRGNPDLAGGGELLDQGVHLLDLSRWFLGKLEVVAAATPRWHWDVAPLEDNAFVILQTPGGHIASLHTSWTMWKNRFSFEVFGQDGYARIDGLGGSYGVETLTVGRKKTEGTIPEETVTQYDQADESWETDWRDLVTSIGTGRNPEVGADTGLAIMRLVDEVYARAEPTRIATVRGASRS